MYPSATTYTPTVPNMTVYGHTKHRRSTVVPRFTHLIKIEESVAYRERLRPPSADAWGCHRNQPFGALHNQPEK